jgi:ATP-dependent DNA helicase DinG
VKAQDRLAPEVIAALRESIADAGGNEVFAIGDLDSAGVVASVQVAARGNEWSVPALRPYLERGAVLIHNHPSGFLSPSGADLGVASQVGGEGIGFFIVDNEVGEIYVVAEPVAVRDLLPLDVDRLASLLEPGGSLEESFPGYEERPTQVDMLRLVARGFNEGRLCVAEAGTGVGKSLAYLIPAMEWAAVNGERVVVSTSTINLQQQLVEKDIPLVRRILGREVKAVLVKGRRNYVCPKRLAEALEDAPLDAEDRQQLEAIAQWASSTVSGSRTDLAFQPMEGVWSQVCSEADLCQGLRCSLRQDCFIHRVRREAASAGLLVVNHHLLFSDLAVRRAGVGYDTSAVLPPFHRIVFDEAHSIEASASSFFSEGFHRYSLMRTLGRLYRTRRGRGSGLLRTLDRMAPEETRQKVAAAIAAVAEASDRLEILDQQAGEMFSGANALLLADLPPDRLNPSFLEPLEELQTALLSLVSVLQTLLEAIPQTDPEDFAIPECRLLLRRLHQAIDVCERFRNHAATPQAAGDFGDGQVYWLELVRGFSGDRFVRLVITPLEIASVMREAVYEPYESVAFTSATLTVGGSFSFWRGRVGLDDDLLQGSFSSPFAYEKRVLVGVPDDLPEPSDSEAYLRSLSLLVGDALEISEGRALVLFTSYAALRHVFDEVNPRLNARGIRVLKQGDDDRTRLLARFVSDISSVLFATDSFWQGVDAPGQALQMLVLTRLPFRVPTDPVLKTRMAAIEAAGGNAFTQLALPDAVMRLRQGFGRLMRRTTDWGVVLILDVRVLRRAYGDAFLQSLPKTMRRTGRARTVLESIEDFVAAMQSEVGEP